MVAAVLALLLLAPGPGPSPGTVDRETGEPVNLGLAAGTNTLGRVADPLAFLRVHEGPQGADLTGDGDLEDWVTFVFDARTGQLHGLGELQGVDLSAELVALVADEALGGADLNGDGDRGDSVLHVFRPGVDAAAVNVGLAVRDPGVFGTRVVFAVDEQAQGGSDLNGDGDALDFVLHLLDGRSGTVTNLGVAVDPDLRPREGAPVRIPGGRIAFAVDEAAQDADLDGDGDRADQVLHVLDPARGELLSIGVAILGAHAQALAPWASEGGPDSSRAPAGPLVFAVPEGGARDLNRDGDALDDVLHHLGPDGPRNLGLALAPVQHPLSPPGRVGEVASRPGYLTFLVGEAEQGATDLNGDGDADDVVRFVHHLEDGVNRPLPGGGPDPRQAFAGERYLFDPPLAYDARARVVTTMPLAGRTIGARGALAAFLVPETTVDLNGDGDVSPGEQVAFLYDARLRRWTATGLAHAGFAALGEAELALAVPEWRQGGVDLDGNGTVSDDVLHLVDLATGLARNLRVPTSFATTQGRHVLAVCGGTFDLPEYLLVRDGGRGSSDRIRRASTPAWPWERDGDLMLYQVHEQLVGRDLNGDGDQADRVMHAWRFGGAGPAAAAR